MKFRGRGVVNALTVMHGYYEGSPVVQPCWIDDRSKDERDFLDLQRVTKPKFRWISSPGGLYCLDDSTGSNRTQGRNSVTEGMNECYIATGGNEIQVFWLNAKGLFKQSSK